MPTPAPSPWWCPNSMKNFSELSTLPLRYIEDWARCQNTAPAFLTLYPGDDDLGPEVNETASLSRVQSTLRGRSRPRGQ
ncbi:hypothetical protein BHYA_0093g00020 [Botrytis hyacinthi]|uniref:Uncharacterized protein n=1 Tax=Botrytis hyacinthi TaxID=278943 RepID=A0A4Z1GW06_9HELO|nr:hypothetical protein BHYA_0093g00020 [Botrytis hyacinthi]